MLLSIEQQPYTQLLTTVSPYGINCSAGIQYEPQTSIRRIDVLQHEI